MAIRREIFVTQKRLDVYIDITYGSDLIPIELVVMDYAIPAEAMAVAYVKSKTSDLKKAVCEISDNVISFTPEAGLFEIGENTMQIRVTYAEKNLFSYKCNVKCQGSFLDDDAEELDSQPTLVAQLLTEVGKVKATTQEVQQEMNEDIDLLYKNISNPNLFINGNFQIWSNGESFQVQNQSTEVVTPVLTADKWYVESVDSTEVLNVNKTNEGLFISSNTSQNCKIYQVLDEETYNAIKWKTLTLSYEYEQPYSAEDTSVYYETHKEVKEIVASEADARIFASNNAIQLPIGNVGGTGCKLHWVKLEVGSIDTLCIPDSKDAIICKLDKEVAELNSKLTTLHKTYISCNLNTDNYGYGISWDIVRIGNIVFAYCGGIVSVENSGTAYELDVLIPDGYKPAINTSATICATVSSTIYGVSKMTYFATGKINIVSQKQGVQDVYHEISWHTNDAMPDLAK